MTRLYSAAGLLTSLTLASLLLPPSADTRVEIHSDDWVLIGDLRVPTHQDPEAFALLLHKAAGDRNAYAQMAEELAMRGIASLRIDLRGHGESINLGAFDPDIGRYLDQSDPAIVRNFELIRRGDRDIEAVMRWLDGRPALTSLPFVVVGSSYSGQEMVEAAQRTRFADIYIALAPGSFTSESIEFIDLSGAHWLFARAEIELPFFPELFDAIQAGSESAEIWLLPGEGHATDLLDHNPDLHVRLVDWISERLTAREQLAWAEPGEG